MTEKLEAAGSKGETLTSLSVSLIFFPSCLHDLRQGMTDNVTGEEQNGHNHAQLILSWLAGRRNWAFADTLDYRLEPPCSCLGQPSPSSQPWVLTAVSALCLLSAVRLGQDEIFQPCKDLMSHDSFHCLPPRPGQFLIFFPLQVSPVSFMPYKRNVCVHTDTCTYPKFMNLNSHTYHVSVCVSKCTHDTRVYAEY